MKIVLLFPSQVQSVNEEFVETDDDNGNSEQDCIIGSTDENSGGSNRIVCLFFLLNRSVRKFRNVKDTFRSVLYIYQIYFGCPQKRVSTSLNPLNFKRYRISRYKYQIQL